MNISTREMAGGLVLVTLVTAALLHLRGDSPDVKAAVAHTETIAAEKHAAIAETVYVAAKADAARERLAAMALHDTVRMRITDTLLVKEVLRRDSLVMVQDAVALADADSAIAAEKATTSAVRKELAIAVQRPRLAFVGEGLYEPIGGVTSGNAAVTVRVAGSFSAIARCSYRVAIGEHARCGVGAQVTL